MTGCGRTAIAGTQVDGVGRARVKGGSDLPSPFFPRYLTCVIEAPEPNAALGDGRLAFGQKLNTNGFRISFAEVPRAVGDAPKIKIDRVRLDMVSHHLLIHLVPVHTVFV